MKFVKTMLAGASMLGLSMAAAQAADCEVTHWWTSGGEAAAVSELAKAYDATGNHWVDGAIAGSGNTARPIMISRITGGDPMCATQFNHGRQAEELVEAGLMRDITDIAEAGKWRDVINPPSILDACTVDGKVYCAPLNIHSQQWLWLSNAAYEKAGIPVPANWNDFVETAPKLMDAGIVPLAMGQQGWQQNLAFQVLLLSLLPNDVYLEVFKDKKADVAGGAEVAKVFQAASTARDLSADSNVQNWNDATNMVITGKAGGQIMGDWAQGEFAIAKQVAGKDYSCLPGLGLKDVLLAGGDAFYFPVLSDPEKTKAQGDLAAMLLQPEVQVAFNLKKGSLPVRGDIDLSAANDCMKKGLEILAKGSTVPAVNQLITSDTRTQMEDLFVEFFANKDMTPDAAQKRFADIISQAE
ncbi:ABC transporter substrate-binding protein [Zhengella mangrovi]|uniref:Probable sugar-binding periplasmic protein n=1 Tax=Zhengella mangrovi TaxID=1982044 RepID=A0A2G1QMP7_9HYPH|nr:ABC transporter substrate-binding protein [Zhengella mangrovi]